MVVIHLIANVRIPDIHSIGAGVLTSDGIDDTHMTERSLEKLMYTFAI
jgi:hypothetical protein